jgi:RND family efflux transporter MFP subunit
MRRGRNLLESRSIGREELDKINERAATAEAAVKSARLDLARARLDLEATKVTAPMAGQVGRALVDPGTLVFRGQDRATLLTTVTSFDPITLTFDMDERSFLRYQQLLRESQVKGAGSALRMQLTGEDSFPHEGKLESFEDRVNATTGTVRVRGSFANPDQRLLPGMFARVRLAFGPPRAVLEIPEEAILSDQGKKHVLVVVKGNIVQRRAVTLGQGDNGMRIIEKGLSAEDWVVIAGQSRIHPGDTVEPQRKAAPARKAPSRDRGH